MSKVYLSPAYHYWNPCAVAGCDETTHNNLYLDVLEPYLTACGIQYKRGPRRTPKSGEDGDALMLQAVRESDAWGADVHYVSHPYVKHTTKIFSLRLMDFQAQAYPDARRKTRGACQLLRVGQSRSPVRPLYNRKRFSCLPPQSKMSWILYAISMRLSGYTSTRSISISASSVVSASASKIALDASFRLSCRACSSCFCFACANTAA